MRHSIIQKIIQKNTYTYKLSFDLEVVSGTCLITDANEAISIFSASEDGSYEVDVPSGGLSIEHDAGGVLNDFTLTNIKFTRVIGIAEQATTPPVIGSSTFNQISAGSTFNSVVQ